MRTKINIMLTMIITEVKREIECKRKRERNRRGNSWEKRSKTMLNYVIQYHILIFR